MVGSNVNRLPGCEFPGAVCGTGFPSGPTIDIDTTGRLDEPTLLPRASVTLTLIGIVLPLVFGVVWSNAAMLSFVLATPRILPPTPSISAPEPPMPIRLFEPETAPEMSPPAVWPAAIVLGSVVVPP